MLTISLYNYSALFGKNEFNRANLVPEDETNPFIVDARVNGRSICSIVNTGHRHALDARDQFSLDADWVINDKHNLRFGLDYKENNSVDKTFYSRHLYWRYVNVNPGDIIQGGIVPDGVFELARKKT